MLNINIFPTTRTGNIMQVEEITLLDCYIIVLVFQYRVALGADDFPSLLLIVIVFQYLHTLYYFKYRAKLFLFLGERHNFNRSGCVFEFFLMGERTSCHDDEVIGASV